MLISLRKIRCCSLVISGVQLTGLFYLTDCAGLIFARSLRCYFYFLYAIPKKKQDKDKPMQFFIKFCGFVSDFVFLPIAIILQTELGYFLKDNTHWHMKPFATFA